jgi:hypothetical protein
MDELVSELEYELSGCNVSYDGSNEIDVYLDTPISRFYNNAVSLAEDVLRECDVEDYSIDGDYEGHFTIEVYELD